MTSNPYSQLWSVIQQHIDMGAIAATLDRGGVLETAEVQCLVADEQRNIWFLVDSNSSVIENLEIYPDICLIFSDAHDNEVASLSGTSVLINNPVTRHALWSSMVPDTPELLQMALVQFSIEYAEYRDAHSSDMVQIVAERMSQTFIPETEFDYESGINNQFNVVQH